MNDRIAGWSFLGSSHAPVTAAGFYAVAVQPSFRRRGIGATLMRRLETALAERGCLKVNLQVRASNAAVVAFFERLGYSIEERVSMGKRLY